MNPGPYFAEAGIMKILVGFDGSASAHQALDRVVEWFAHSGAEVLLLGALMPPMTISDLSEEAHRTALAELERDLERAAVAVRDAGCLVRARVVEGEPREVLDRVTQEEEPALVVVGSRGRSRIARLLLGSVSSYAVQHLNVPVLVVR